MLSFFLKRILSGLLVIFSVTVIISSIIYLAPVDPARLTFGQRSEAKTVEQKRKALGLDLAFHTQLFRYLGDISPVVVSSSNRFGEGSTSLNLGIANLIVKKPNLRLSYQSGRQVSEILKETIPQTFILAFTALLFASLIGITLGFIAAINKHNYLDDLIISVSTLGYSIPSYVSAIILAIGFGFILKDYTGLNMQGSLFDINDLGDDILCLKNLILPALALGVRPVAVITQLTRSAVLDILQQDYVKTAKAKGLNFGTILKKHVLKNSMNPIVTTISGWFASLLAGAFFVEYVFNFKGLGFTTVTALLNYDVPVLLGCIIFISVCFVILNLFVDFIYKSLDPRA